MTDKDIEKRMHEITLAYADVIPFGTEITLEAVNGNGDVKVTLIKTRENGERDIAEKIIPLLDDLGWVGDTFIYPGILGSQFKFFNSGAVENAYIDNNGYLFVTHAGSTEKFKIKNFANEEKKNEIIERLKENLGNKLKIG